MNCRICFNSTNNTHIQTKEMMFGYRTHFDYFECSACGCLQIKEYLVDASSYYPPNYYSVNNFNKAGLLKLLKSWRNRNSLNPKGVSGFVVNRFFPENRYQSLRLLETDKTQAILDIGCGSGEMIHFLNRLGFTDLTGVDPFIENDIIYNSQVRVFKKNVFELNRQFDFIMMHHAFEHMQSPESVLKKIKEHLSDKGTLLIRIPVGRSFAFEKYGSNWVQLDAPRHLYLHTLTSMQILCDRLGLKIVNVTYDSRPFQFWGSEMYADDVPLISNAGKLSKLKNFVKYRLLRNYDKLTKEMNATQRGDQAAFYIKKSPQ